MKSGSFVVVVLALAVVACGPSALPTATTGTATAQPTAAAPPATSAEAGMPTVPPAGQPLPVEEPNASTSPDSPGTAPTPDLQGFPTAPAPGELATVTLPDDFTEVAALFERLPPEIVGHTRAPQYTRVEPERAVTGYGEDRRTPNAGGPLLAIQSSDLTRGDFFPPNLAGGQVVAEMARHGEEIKDAGRDGELIWMRQDTFMATAESAERFPVYTPLWGRIDTPWMFSLRADTPENRDALLAAFVAAAKVTGQ